MEHKVEIRPYRGVTSAGFDIEIPHQRQILVDGQFVGYCPVFRQPLPIAGSLPAEIRRAVEEECGRFWADSQGPAEAALLAPMSNDTEGDDE